MPEALHRAHDSHGVIGELADPVWRSMYAACLEAVERTIAGMGPGVSTLDLAQHASEPLTELPPRCSPTAIAGIPLG